MSIGYWACFAAHRKKSLFRVEKLLFIFLTIRRGRDYEATATSPPRSSSSPLASERLGGTDGAI